MAYPVALIVFMHCLHRAQRDALRLGRENAVLLKRVKPGKETAHLRDLERSRLLAAADHNLRQPPHAASFYLDLLQAWVSRLPSREVVALQH